MTAERVPSQPPVGGSPSVARVVGVGAAVHATSMLPTFLTGALAVQIQEELGFGPTALGLATGSFVFARACSSIGMGRLADHLGAIRSMRLSAIGCAVAATAGALAVHSWAMLVVVLLAAGVVQAISQPAANRFVARGVPPARLGLAFGLKQSGPPLAIALAGLAVPTIALTVGWRWAFAIAAVLAALTLVTIPPRVPPASPTADRAPDRPRERTSTAGLGLVMTGNAMALAAINAMHTFVVGSGVDAGIPAGIAGLLLTVGSIVAIGVRIWSGAVADRRTGGHLRWVAGMLSVGAFGYVLLAIGHPAVFLVGVVLAYGATWGMTGVLFLAIVRRSPGAPAAASGKIIAAGSVGGFCGPPLFGLVVQHAGFSLAWLSAAALSAMAALAIVRSTAAREERAAARSPGRAASHREPSITTEGNLVSTDNTVHRDFGAVACSVHRHVATLRIGGGGDLNVMRTDTYQCLLEAVRWCADEPSVRVVVLIGEGENFSIGGDHRVHRERDVHDFRAHLSILLEIAGRMRTMGKPVIAAVRGRCTGGMNQIALLADLTLASETARFGQYGARSGSLPSLWGTQLLPLTIGEKRAREMVYLCWEYDAHEAKDMGLINRVLPDDALEAEVARWTDRLLEMSPRSLRFAKTAINAGSDQRSSAVWHGRDALAEWAGTEEHQEAIDSYLEGRTPAWYPPEDG